MPPRTQVILVALHISVTSHPVSRQYAFSGRSMRNRSPSLTLRYCTLSWQNCIPDQNLFQLASGAAALLGFPALLCTGKILFVGVIAGAARGMHVRGNRHF